MAAKTEGSAVATQENASQIHGPTCMESVNRIAQFPVVESTIQTATSIYSKVKDYNSVTQWTFATTEQAVNKAVEVGKPIASPVVKGLEGPIRKVDSVLCSGLDYVEAKVPAVKMPAGEVYSSTKDLVESTMVGAKAYVEPTVNAAFHTVEPVIERTRQVVEPLVAPVLQGALHGAEQVRERVGEYLHNHQHHANNDGEIECKDCNKAKKQ